MDSSVSLRSFHGYVPTVSTPQTLAERTGAISFQSRSFSRRFVYSPAKRNLCVLSCAKTSDASVASKSGDGAVPVVSENNVAPRGTFPNGLEALLLEVCDETEVAELKLKVGDFEMHLRRNIGATTAAPLPIISPTVAPPIPSEPMDIAVPAVTPAPASTSPLPSSPKKSDPFINVSFGKSPKLAVLEASGATGYVLVASPTVGSFRKSPTAKKGKPQPPALCKEGDMIKEGQVIGFLDQFGTELPVRSDVAGEVVKILFDDGDGVGYKDPLMAVLPSFPGIQK